MLRSCLKEIIAYLRHNGSARRRSLFKNNFVQFLASGLKLLNILLADEFKGRDFRWSLKYITPLDLDVLFPSAHKLMMAENISPKIK